MSRHDFVRAAGALAFCAGLLPATVTAQETLRVVLKGHDPVAYFTEGKAVRGDPRLSYDFDEGRYYFSNAKHRAMFAADPERYAPQFAGYCTGSMSRNVRNEGHPEAWVIADGRLYVFGAGDSESALRAKRAAEKDLDAFRVKTASAMKNWRK